MHTGPGIFAPRPGARARTVWVAVLLSVVVVSLLGSAAPGFADGPEGGRSDDLGGADRRTNSVGEVQEKPDRVQPGRDGGDAPASPSAEPPSAEPAAEEPTDSAAQEPADGPPYEPAPNGRSSADAPDPLTTQRDQGS